MSDLEDSARNFLQRWARRKRAAENHTPDNADLSPDDKSVDSNTAAQGDIDPQVFDPATLPSIESITATSDIRAFLAPGVPEELTRAALRRVWVTDPTIRSFVGIAENQWDFTKPDSIPGFGSLKVAPELLRMVASLIGDATGQRQKDVEQVEQISETSGQLPPLAKALALGENDGSAERSPTRPGFAISEVTCADPVRIVAQDSNQDSDNDALMQKSIGDTGGSSQSIYRKHGGAVPK